MNDRKLQLYRRKIDACPKCECGVVRIFSDEGSLLRLETCECALNAARELRYDNAYIPTRFRDFVPEHYNEDFLVENADQLAVVQEYAINITDRVAHGSGLFVQGNVGLGKSALACYVLRQALDADLVGHYYKARDLVGFRFASMDRVGRLREAVDSDILVIDEIEKLPTGVPNVALAMNQTISDLYDRRCALIVVSGLTKKSLVPLIGEDAADRLQELQDVVFVGQSYRQHGDEEDLLE